MFYRYALGKIALIKCDSFNFDFHSVGIGDLCISFAWNFEGHGCIPVTYTLQGFEPENVQANQLNPPNLSVNSTSATFSLIKSFAVRENLYYQIVGVDSSGMVCNANSMTGYLNYSLLLETGLLDSN